MEEYEILALTDDGGNEFPFAVIDRVGYRGRNYIVLLPVDDPDCDEFLIMRVNEVSRGREEYLTIEDEATLQAVFRAFQERHQGEYEFR